MVRASEALMDRAPVVVPLIAAAGMAVRYQVAGGVSVCLLIAIVLAPVWIGSLRAYRGMRVFVLLGVGAAIWGTLGSLLDPVRTFSASLFVVETSTFLAMVGAVGTLLWARQCVGSSWMVIAFAIGGLVNVALTGGNPVNLWKYSLSIPITLLVVALAEHFGGRIAEIAAVAAIAVISGLNDSRSFTAFLLLALMIAVWQLTGRREGAAAKPLRVLIGAGLLGLAVFNLIQALLLEGVLGSASQQRSQAQMDATGSLITGGRPEMGASFALLVRQPWGYGAGSLPTSTDVWVAKSGMSELNYDPNNGYVEVFMFGGRFEVHSVLGDLWLRFGPLGAAVAIFICVYAVMAVAKHVSLRSASAVLVLLTVLTLWDTLFSPFLSSYRTMALVLALAAAPVLDRLPIADTASPSPRFLARLTGGPPSV
ncbi:hypothetical protein GE115_09475 [Agromyces sp. CFH 90414]|uniref:O-antigen ligase domain-containing protein n=1 Tax=Agromyces agglutinans TaxID=2662258 RepID=A0A6I2FGR6_9MICO|nr:hypothetical protein [Agromyces agglutinans]MRG60098.1 hypothetical protein [Agromyces agglutinans]